MSKILIVGNGPSALKNKYGELIDSDKWDVVMRFNRWDKNDDGTKHNDYSEYIGTRCDYWMINDLRLQVGINRRNDYRKDPLYKNGPPRNHPCIIEMKIIRDNIIKNNFNLI